jgi:NAD(P)H-dependent nitrite reductase small subunit
MSADGYVEVANVSDIPDDEGICVAVGEQKIALFKYEGRVYALNNICPHQGAPLHEGFFDDGIVTCPLHAWDFDVKTGKVRGGTEHAVIYPVRLSGDIVEVSIE